MAGRSRQHCSAIAGLIDKICGVGLLTWVGERHVVWHWMVNVFMNQFINLRQQSHEMNH